MSFGIALIFTPYKETGWGGSFTGDGRIAQRPTLTSTENRVLKARDGNEVYISRFPKCRYFIFTFFLPRLYDNNKEKPVDS